MKAREVLKYDLFSGRLVYEKFSSSVYDAYILVDSQYDMTRSSVTQPWSDMANIQSCQHQSVSVDILTDFTALSALQLGLGHTHNSIQQLLCNQQRQQLTNIQTNQQLSLRFRL